jgi:CubicO group peptidase (beta-lactamase class C family)
MLTRPYAALIFLDGLDYDLPEAEKKMRPAIRMLAILSLVLSVAGCRPADTSSWTEMLDAHLEGLASAGEPGLAVLVVDDGRVAFERAIGVTDLRTRRGIDGATNFRLASVTKQLTAAAVMLLVRDGKLGYEDRLTDFFPDFPEYGRPITVRHLLNHTSGLPDYEDLMPPADPSVPLEEVQIRDDEVLDLMQKQAAGEFIPGTRWAYSNSAYVLLGLAVAKASGQPFGEFLRERVFAPLGMSGTAAHEPGRDDVPNRAYGHSLEDGRWRETDQSPTSATLGDGGVYSSLADLLKWDEALRCHTLLSEAEMRPALTPAPVTRGLRKDVDGRPVAYGFGWYLNPWQGRPRMWHTGETAGFRTAIMRFTGDGLTVIVLCNRADLDARRLALKAAELCLSGRR